MSPTAGPLCFSEWSPYMHVSAQGGFLSIDETNKTIMRIRKSHQGLH